MGAVAPIAPKKLTPIIWLVAATDITTGAAVSWHCSVDVIC